MSAVRMCDSCGTIYSERAEGHGTGSFTTSRRNERTGRMEQVTETRDLCPTCNAPLNESLNPQLAVAGVAEVERLAQTIGAELDH